MSVDDPSHGAKAGRQRRLEEQLRENLKRRKEQARARRAPPGEDGASEPSEDRPGKPAD